MNPMRTDETRHGLSTLSRLRITAMVSILSLWVLILVLWVIWMSKGLRPIADDYSRGAGLTDGPITAVVNLWNSWAGDLATNLVNVVIVGIPLQYLPWSFGSSIAFLASGVMVSIVLLFVINSQTGTNKKLTIPKRLILLPLALVAWWSYWWVNKEFNPNDSFYESTTTSITFWQNVNATYVFIPSIGIFLWLVIERIRKKHPNNLQVLPLYFLVGFVIGMSGIVFAVSFMIFVTLMLIASWLDSRSPRAPQILIWASFITTVFLAALASHFSPGSQNRTTFLPKISLDNETILQLLHTVFPSLSDWLKSLVNPGMAISVIIIVIFATLLTLQGHSFDDQNLRQIGLGLIGFSLILFLVNGFSEVFAYAAFWHRIQGSTILWIGIVSLGVSFALRISKSQIKPSVLVFSGVVVSIVSTVAVLQMTLEISARSSLWESGPAPTTYIADIEDENGWQRVNWLILRNQIGGPDRGL